MQIFSRRFMQVGVLIFVTIALTLSAQAATFSKASLKGSYSFLINLWTANASTNQVAMVGVLAFDGAGNVRDRPCKTLEPPEIVGLDPWNLAPKAAPSAKAQASRRNDDADRHKTAPVYRLIRSRKSNIGNPDQVPIRGWFAV